jgi:V8-like Glu-specific endopeptidase
LTAWPAAAQDDIVTRLVELDIDSGWVFNRGDAPATLFFTVIEVADAAWMRLEFQAVVLPGDADAADAADASYLRITALADGAAQRLNARHTAQWRNTTAYFNGDAVLLELIGAPGGAPCRVALREATVGARYATRTICGGIDDRVLSTDPAVGRAMPAGCTAWLLRDCMKCLLSAGHCVSGGISVIQFNVPLSNPDGTVNHPPPEDQYAVDPASQQWSNGAVGDDWLYFGCFPNSNTGLTPYEAQQAALELALAPPAPTGQPVRVTGYGTVSAPITLAWNQVQKTHTAPLTAVEMTYLRYEVDTTGGNSGSPIIDDSTGQALGIHTTGGCNLNGGSNSGTASNCTGLRAALSLPTGVCAAGGLYFSFPYGRPTLIAPDGYTRIRVQIAPGSLAPEPNTMLLHYDAGAGYLSVPMQALTSTLYEGEFPPIECEATVHYYISAEGENGYRYYEPGGAFPPLDDYTALVAYDVDALWSDAFEADSGWTVGAPEDTATAGVWNRMDPEYTGVQPGDDHSLQGQACWITDGRAGETMGTYDVDGGRTTLSSPVLDLTTMPEARISYWRWYSNHLGASPHSDVFYVDISADGGQSWINVETIGPSGPDTVGGWRYHEFAVSSFVVPSATVQIRFVAVDDGATSLIEAAIDDFVVSERDCTAPSCLGDANGDSVVENADLQMLLDAWGAQDGELAYDPKVDVNHDGVIGNADLQAILDNWQRLCF